MNLKELGQIIDHAREAPLSEKLKKVLHALAGMLPVPRSTEKTSALLPPADAQQQSKYSFDSDPAPKSPTGGRKMSEREHLLYLFRDCPQAGRKFMSIVEKKKPARENTSFHSTQVRA